MVTKAKTTAKAKTSKAKTSKATTRKPAAKKAMVTKKVVPTVKVAAKAPATPAASVQGVTRSPTPALRKKELIDAVVARSGIKKKDAKPVIETMLAVLGETLLSGKDMNLQPFGRVMVKKTVEKDNANVLVAKIRQVKPKTDAVVKVPMGQAAE